jgi:hypothetical protein
MAHTDLVPARQPDVYSPNPLLELTPTEGQPVFVRNPHLWEMHGAAVLLLGSAAGCVWSVWRDYSRADLAFGAFLASIVAGIVAWRRFHAWDTDYLTAEPVDPA